MFEGAFQVFHPASRTGFHGTTRSEDKRGQTGFGETLWGDKGLKGPIFAFFQDARGFASGNGKKVGYECLNGFGERVAVDRARALILSAPRQISRVAIATIHLAGLAATQDPTTLCEGPNGSAEISARSEVRVSKKVPPVPFRDPPPGKGPGTKCC